MKIKFMLAGLLGLFLGVGLEYSTGGRRHSAEKNWVEILFIKPKDSRRKRFIRRSSV